MSARQAVSFDQLDVEQQRAAKLIQDATKPVFVTGPAGCGKSFLIRYLRDNFRAVVTATTGIAATLINGRTIHSVLGMRPGSTHVAMERFADRVRGADFLIVDEVSMMNAWMFSALVHAVANLEAQFTEVPRLVTVGDFLQLPPVEGGYAFYAPEWSGVTKIGLSIQHRQQDPEFIQVLSDLRLGVISNRALQLIDRRKQPPVDGVTKLVPHRATSATINLEELKKLSSPITNFERRVTKGDPSLVMNIAQNRGRFPRLLPVRVGARVVMLTNTDHWCNGSRGWVEEVDAETVSVRLDHGDVVEVERVEEIFLNGDGNEQGRVSQLPMTLAWALTIHKAQGMTLDEVFVDLNNHFAYGQTYVALSRCKSSSGLYVAGDLHGVAANEDAKRVAMECGMADLETADA